MPEISICSDDHIRFQNILLYLWSIAMWNSQTPRGVSTQSTYYLLYTVVELVGCAHFYKCTTLFAERGSIYIWAVVLFLALFSTHVPLSVIQFPLDCLSLVHRGPTLSGLPSALGSSCAVLLTDGGRCPGLKWGGSMWSSMNQEKKKKFIAFWGIFFFLLLNFPCYCLSLSYLFDGSSDLVLRWGGGEFVRELDRWALHY